MASTATTNPALITSVNTTGTATGIIKLVHSAGLSGTQVCVKISSGTFYFGVGAAPDTSLSPAFTSSDNVPPITIGGGPGNDLWYKASASGGAFAITF